MPWPQPSASKLGQHWPTEFPPQIASTSCAENAQNSPQNAVAPPKRAFTSNKGEKTVQSGAHRQNSSQKMQHSAIQSHQQFSTKSIKFTKFAFNFFLISFLLPLYGALAQMPANSAQPRPTCREHLLNGHAQDGIFPILSPSGTIFWLECRFPPPGSQSARLSVQIVVNNALVGQWIGAEWAKNSPNGIQIQQQINDRDFLHQLMADSDECAQKVRIKWASILKRNESALGEEILFAETFAEQKLEFRRNSTIHDSYEDILTIHKGPIVRIGSPFPQASLATLGPLVCRQTLIPRPECQFELRSDSDRIRLKLPLLRRKAISEGASTVSISFRTGKPSERLLELLDGGHGPLGAMDLIDGYLLFANHITYPAKLLADGLWHSLHLDLHSFSLRVDDLSTALSMRAAINDGDPLWLDVLAQGEVAAIRFGGQDGSRPGEWICGEEPDLMDIRQSMPQQHIFARPSVCSASMDERNFCNCKGPNSALSPNGGIGRQPGSAAQCSAIPNEEDALHLSRLADRLAFVLVPNFGSKMPISVLFKSESQTGLLFFGIYSTPSSPLPKAMLAPNGGRELGGRVQVHFVGNQLFGAICSQLADGTEKCFSCSIQMDGGFDHSDRWHRVSLFYQLNQQFLAVDDKVCLLSPNAHVVDPAELYRISATNILLVGGAFYAKHPLLSQRVSDQFRRQFQDNTREKAPSLAGCFGEILLRGQRQNLSQLVADQAKRAQRDGNGGEGDGNIFSVKVGCQECPSKCNGASCSRQWTVTPFEKQSPICQCTQIYAAATNNNGECQIHEGTLENGNEGGMRMGVEIEEAMPPLEIPIFGASTPARGLQGRRQLDRIWLLMRLPEANAEMRPFIGIGSLQISVGQNGHRLVVESKEFGLLEEFLIPNPLDARLHLLAIQRNPEIGTGTNGHLLTIHLDNDHRRVHLEEILSLTSLDGSPPKIQIRPISLQSNEGEEGPFGGCIEELIFNFVPLGEALSTMAYGFMPTLMEQQNGQEVDYIAQFRDQFPQKFASNADGSPKNCGIRDPSLWAGNATSWGKMVVKKN